MVKTVGDPAMGISMPPLPHSELVLGRLLWPTSIPCLVPLCLSPTSQSDQYRFLWTAIRGLIFLNLVYFDIASTFGSTEPSSSTEQKTKTTENYDAESGK